ncbi:hypothetical protein EMIHUDRAFT_431866 [Emiliania huxleyi CCMP1516]|uniref:EXS domain-containing protein n=2 Tax=Emiliania huxleyi TaxID=2903 RepID=A0A0D3L1N0_EMIH1|nr:hypothetical protein EMIHUDRAFT_431866 [Emiliania huxleyi CCMP1516]EOD41915.1 hypothetical protein EMIHUDRAFT_431866 [Emiliania huxleyi CCMP1516]|eukprot:XP_005794344.1 hypothetical protein EMIHUDRAFT_431866 [Emiliania huxleyi CCMP1516]
MFLMSAVLMAAAQRQGGPMYEFALGYYPLFRGLFLICFFCSCYGIVLFLWKRHDVDYRSVLGVPQQHNYHSIVTLSFLAMSFVFGCFALYVLSLTDHLTPYKHAWPAIAAGTSLLFLIFPFDWMPEWRDARQRAALCRSLARGTFLSPFLVPELSDTILTDVLCSMPKLFLDLLRTGCLYATGEAYEIEYDEERARAVGMSDTCTNEGSRLYFACKVLLSLGPFAFRLAQCQRQLALGGEVRHVFNSLKYGCAISVVALSLLSDSDLFKCDGVFVAWLAMSVISTLYCSWWDLYMDWGFPVGARALGVSQYLGETAVADPLDGRLFPRRSFQVGALANTVARAGWAVYISPDQRILQQHVVLLLGCVELLRRAQWCAFRVEWAVVSQLRARVPLDTSSCSLPSAQPSPHAEAVRMAPAGVHPGGGGAATVAAASSLLGKSHSG